MVPWQLAVAIWIAVFLLGVGMGAVGFLFFAAVL